MVPFINPRRKPLSVLGRRFVFSMMHEQIRVPNPDYAEIGLCICHFATAANNERSAALSFDRGVELFSFDQMQDMLDETYAIWAEVREGRIAETRRRGNGLG